jgi:hypothetical protein
MLEGETVVTRKLDESTFSSKERKEAQATRLYSSLQKQGKDWLKKLCRSRNCFTEPSAQRNLRQRGQLQEEGLHALALKREAGKIRTKPTQKIII